MTVHPKPVRSLHLTVGSRKIFCLHHAPARVPRGAVVYVPPFAEEMNKSRRMAAIQSRALAGEGWHVLRFDFAGTGDSEGDFADASWAGWLDDIAAARAWVAGQTGFEPWLWGLRLGGLLAAVSLQGRGAPGLVLWQPVLSGRQHLQQFLRLQTGAEWLSAGREAAALTKPMDLLHAGEPVEVAGYSLSPSLALRMAEANLELPDGLPRLVWFEISPREGACLAPASERLVGPRRSGRSLQSAVIKGPTFWQAVEVETVPALITATCAALSE